MDNQSTPTEPVDQTTSAISKSAIEALRETIAFVSAGASLFVVLFYLAGRSFSSGYFDAMNIPLYLLNFSLWEYAEVGGLGLFLVVFGLVAVASLFAWVLYTIEHWFVIRFRNKSADKGNIKSASSSSPAELNKDARLSIQIFIFTVICFAVFLFFSYALTVVSDFGEHVGQVFVLENSSKVELVSASPLALDDNTLAPSKASGQDTYIYQGFRLLTFNEGKYYLFKEIDPISCKPLKVYIIPAEKDIQINLSTAEDITGKCQSLH